jgi:hypothetical protein
MLARFASSRMKIDGFCTNLRASRRPVGADPVKAARRVHRLWFHPKPSGSVSSHSPPPIRRAISSTSASVGFRARIANIVCISGKQKWHCETILNGGDDIQQIQRYEDIAPIDPQRRPEEIRQKTLPNAQCWICLRPV